MHGNKALIHTTRLIINIFHLLLYVTEIVKQSQTVRGGRFELSLLTWPGEPNTHVWEPSHPHNFSPFFPVRGSGSPAQSTRGPRTADTAGPLLFLHSPLDGTEVRRVGEVHLPVQSGT